ncbi:MAG: HEAT repeat domain-containing protein [Candidatus Omnitrophota bacterium]
MNYLIRVFQVTRWLVGYHEGLIWACNTWNPLGKDSNLNKIRKKKGFEGMLTWLNATLSSSVLPIIAYLAYTVTILCATYWGLWSLSWAFGYFFGPEQVMAVLFGDFAGQLGLFLNTMFGWMPKPHAWILGYLIYIVPQFMHPYFAVSAVFAKGPDDRIELQAEIKHLGERIDEIEEVMSMDDKDLLNWYEGSGNVGKLHAKFMTERMALEKRLERQELNGKQIKDHLKALDAVLKKLRKNELDALTDHEIATYLKDLALNKKLAKKIGRSGTDRNARLEFLKQLGEKEARRQVKDATLLRWRLEELLKTETKLRNMLEKGKIGLQPYFHIAMFATAVSLIAMAFLSVFAISTFAFYATIAVIWAFTFGVWLFRILGRSLINDKWERAVYAKKIRMAAGAMYLGFYHMFYVIGCVHAWKRIMSGAYVFWGKTLHGEQDIQTMVATGRYSTRAKGWIVLKMLLTSKETAGEKYEGKSVRWRWGWLTLLLLVLTAGIIAFMSRIHVYDAKKEWEGERQEAGRRTPGHTEDRKNFAWRSLYLSFDLERRLRDPNVGTVDLFVHGSNRIDEAARRLREELQRRGGFDQDVFDRVRNAGEIKRLLEIIEEMRREGYFVKDLAETVFGDYHPGNFDEDWLNRRIKEGELAGIVRIMNEQIDGNDTERLRRRDNEIRILWELVRAEFAAYRRVLDHAGNVMNVKNGHLKLSDLIDVKIDGLMDEILRELENAGLTVDRNGDIIPLERADSRHVGLDARTAAGGVDSATQVVPGTYDLGMNLRPGIARKEEFAVRMAGLRPEIRTYGAHIAGVRVRGEDLERLREGRSVVVDGKEISVEQELIFEFWMDSGVFDGPPVDMMPPKTAIGVVLVDETGKRCVTWRSASERGRWYRVSARDVSNALTIRDNGFDMTKVQSCEIIFVIPANSTKPVRAGTLRIRNLRIQDSIPDMTGIRRVRTGAAGRADGQLGTAIPVTQQRPAGSIVPTGQQGIFSPKGMVSQTRKQFRHARSMYPRRYGRRSHAFTALSGLKAAFLTGAIFLACVFSAGYFDFTWVTPILMALSVYSGWSTARFSKVSINVYKAFRRRGNSRWESLKKAIAGSDGSREPEFDNLKNTTKDLVDIHEAFKSHLAGMFAMLPGAVYLMMLKPEYREWYLSGWGRGRDAEYRQWYRRSWGSKGTSRELDIEKRVSESVRTLVERQTRDDRIAAIMTIGNIGPEAMSAVPALLFALADKDPVIVRASMEALRMMGYLKDGAQEVMQVLVAALKDIDQNVRRAAARALQKVGPSATQALPELMALQGDRYPTVRQAAMNAIASIDKTKTLTKTDKVLRQAQRRAPPAGISKNILSLIDQLKAEKTRAEAIMELIDAGRSAVPTLLENLKNEDVNIRREILIVLAFAGLSAKDEISAVIEMFKDADEGVRQAAATALANISPDAEEALPLLIAALPERESGLSQAAMMALARLRYISRGETDVVATLIKALLDGKRVNLRRIAVKALGQMGPEAEKAVPALINMLEDKTVQREIIIVLGKIKPEPRKVVPGLMKSLEKANYGLRSDFLRREIMKLLSQMGPAAIRALPVVREIAEDSSTTSTVRQIAREAIANITADTEDSTEGSGGMPTTAGSALLSPVVVLALIGSVIVGTGGMRPETIVAISGAICIALCATMMSFMFRNFLQYRREKPVAIVIGVTGMPVISEIAAKINRKIGGVKIIALNGSSKEDNMKILARAKRRYGAYGQGIIDMEESGISESELPLIIGRFVDEIQARDKELLTVSDFSRSLKAVKKGKIRNINSIFKEVTARLPVIKYLEVSELSVYNMRLTNNVKMHTSRSLSPQTVGYILDAQTKSILSIRANSLGEVKLLAEAHRKRMEQAGYSDIKAAPVKLQVRLAVKEEDKLVLQDTAEVKQPLLQKMEIDDVLGVEDLVMVDENAADKQTVKDIYKGIKGYDAENIAIVESARAGRENETIPEDIVFMEYEGMATSMVYDVTLTLIAKDVDAARVLAKLNPKRDKQGRVWFSLPPVKGIDTGELRKEIEHYHEFLKGA